MCVQLQNSLPAEMYVLQFGFVRGLQCGLKVRSRQRQLCHTSDAQPTSQHDGLLYIPRCSTHAGPASAYTAYTVF